MVNYIILIRRQPYQAEEMQMKHDMFEIVVQKTTSSATRFSVSQCSKLYLKPLKAIVMQ